ncbi:type II secretion system F family protein [Ammoniphilus sp. CFH 90114]|uniref:type II secretion system F family protein n=1 Tax=Ammoniphilus sp. CFH 90114 TaxID=2493665 RepID=UPI00100FC274|nr:type II secretion system F family protein [Ammoniphilus sp. CFH 90114]RXT13567.1 type II secretion system F family protein [Ammoniphilus sp. CFH 90114]
MSKFLFLIGSFGFFTLIIAGLLHYLLRSRLRVERRLLPLIGVEEPADLTPVQTEEKSLRERVIQPIWFALRRTLSDQMPSKATMALEKRLQEAGSPFQWTAVDYRLIQFILFGVLLVGSLAFFTYTNDSMGKVMIYSFLTAALGFFYPFLYIVDKRKQRILAIEKSLSDFFDMVGVSLEAGMGLDGALYKVSKRMEGPLSKEILQALDEMKLGKSRRDAFTSLRDRVPSEPFQSVMSALIQADQFGIGMTKVLRAQTRRLREQRRQAAREKAMKAPIKMMIPMVLLIFPTLFIVILGPIIVQVITQLF